MIIENEVREKIKDLAAKSSQEICGFIVDYLGYQDVFACENNAEDPTHDFSISPRAFLMAENFGKILAVYHSHLEKEDFSEKDIGNRDAYNLPFFLYCVKSDEFKLTQPGEERPEKYEKYLNRPFEMGVTDCFSIVRDFYKIELGIEIQDYPRKERWFEGNRKMIEEGAEKEGFVLLEPRLREEFDILIFKAKSEVFPRHFGISLNSGQFLHHPRNRHSCIENLSSFPLNLIYAARKK